MPGRNQRFYIEKLTLLRPSESLSAGLCVGEFATFENEKEFTDLLHPEERKYYEALRFEKRRKSYLIGRLTGKKAIAALIEDDHCAEILIRAGIFNQPVISFSSCAHRDNLQNLQVSISHCDNLGAAVAFPEAHPMGIDIERIHSEQNEAIERETTPSEISLAKSLPFAYEVMLTLLWTVKEALSKVLRTGLTTPFKLYEIATIEIQSDFWVSTYKNFSQYKAVSFILGQSICTIVYPLETDLSVNIRALKETFRTSCR